MKKNIVCIGILLLVLVFSVITLASFPTDDAVIVNTEERVQSEQATVQQPATEDVMKGPWENAVKIYGNTTHSLSFSDSFSEKWFELEPMTEGKSVILTISCDDQAATGVISALYYKEDVLSQGNNAERLFGTYMLNKPSAYKISKGGSYYLKVSVIGNSAIGSNIKLNYTTIVNDIYEDNDVWERATPIDIKKPYIIDISAINDIDWFKISLQKDQALQYIIRNDISSGKGVNVALYREEDLIKNGDTAPVLFTSTEFNKYYTHKNDKTQTYYLKVTPSAREAVLNKVTLITDIIPPDSLEGNDSYDQAVMLTPGVAKTVTISASNDVDWLMVKTDKPGQTVKLSIRNASFSGAKLICDWYEGARLIAGSEAAETLYKTRGTGTSYVYMEEAGTYYFKLYTVDNSVITTPIEISYTVIPADRYEPNNDYQSAKIISGNSETRFTLPALNDQDWFAVKTYKENQALRLNTYIPKTGASVNIFVYRQDDVESYGEAAPLFTFNSAKAPYIYMLEEKGTYYIKIVSDTIISDDCILYLSLLNSDANELNNTRDTATYFPAGERKTFTISGVNDTDWFYFNVGKDNSVIDYIMQSDFNKYAKVSIYSEAELDSYEEYAVPLFTSDKYDERVAYKLDKAGKYYIKIDSALPVLDDIHLEYTIRESDKHENNDTWNKATPLTPTEKIDFTIRAANDADWFKISSSGTNKMSLTFNISSKYMMKDAINIYVYREVDLLNYGSRAQHIYVARTSDISNFIDISDGTYYLKAVAVKNDAFDFDYTLRANVFKMQD
ncbi:MAG: hypothetical protein BWX78_00127 [Firmicutes bacterium ADurb.Bin099]|nr:MAG: hypothetical protein BWX78_00127 [Firmicutes bacterium ADurb.Bin099]